MELNEQIKIAREKRGLTQAELAARLKVSKTAVDYWESGRNAPRLRMLAAIEALLETKFNVTPTGSMGDDRSELGSLSAEDLQLALAISRLPAALREAVVTIVMANDPLHRLGAERSEPDLRYRVGDEVVSLELKPSRGRKSR
ncbi:helix-turn-helix transcriptional regulator [Paracidovorax citrulli]